MKTVKIEKDKCTITLNEEFYPREAIEEAVESFEEEATLNEKGSVILKKSKDPEESAYEFCDYVLSLMQGGSRWH